MIKICERKMNNQAYLYKNLRIDKNKKLKIKKQMEGTDPAV